MPATGQHFKFTSTSHVSCERVYLVVVTSDDLHILCYSAQPFVCLSVADIASAENLLDFSGNKELLKLGGKVVSPMRNVQVADHQDQDHSGDRDKVERERRRLFVSAWPNGYVCASTRLGGGFGFTVTTMASSLSPECTPLKQEYDSCFNAWFEGYLEPAVSSAVATPDQRAVYSQQKAAEYEQKCGKVWEAYRACVQVRPISTAYKSITDTV